MKDKNKWILEHIDDLIQLVYVRDYMQNATPDQRLVIHDKLCNLLFSMLWVAMGAHIPNNMYKINDYSVLWGILDDELEIEDY